MSFRDSGFVKKKITNSDNGRNIPIIENKDRPEKEDKENNWQEKFKEQTQKGKKIMHSVSYKIAHAHPNKKPLIFFVGSAILFLFLVSYIALPRAVITVTPKADVLIYITNIILADYQKNFNELSINKNHLIASYPIETIFEKEIKFPATGKIFEGSNAVGKITIFNNTTKDKKFVPSRFATKDGLVFWTNEDVIVPHSYKQIDPATNKEKIIPGEITVSARAAEKDLNNNPIGERGNIIPANFYMPSIPTLSPSSFWGKSGEPFSGGVTKIIKVITKSDLEAASKKAPNDLFALAEEELKKYVLEKNITNQTSLTFLSGQEALQKELVSLQIPQELEGISQDDFMVKVKIRIRGIAFDKNELMQILQTEMTEKVHPEKRLLKIDQESLNYQILNRNNQSGKIKITAEIKGIEEYDLSPNASVGKRWFNSIKGDILGQSVAEAKKILFNLPEISRVEIDVWPFWLPTIPKLPENIKIELAR